MTKLALACIAALAIGWGVVAPTLAAQQPPAAEPVELAAARTAYAQALGRGEPAAVARERYLSGLVRLRWRFVAAARAPGEHPDLEAAWQAVDIELRANPQPETVDGRALARRIVGRWRSPRHDYRYRNDGTWTMLPAYLEGGVRSTHGRWRVEGNRWMSDYQAHTVILLTKRDWVSTDGEHVSYYTRLGP